MRIVTDHGWLLLPGGLPKVELPHYLAATRWTRCAAVRGESGTTVPVYSWYWDPHARIASPPGIGAGWTHRYRETARRRRPESHETPSQKPVSDRSALDVRRGLAGGDASAASDELRFTQEFRREGLKHSAKRPESPPTVSPP